MDLQQCRTDDEAYYQSQEKQRDRWEALCRRCGACCGVIEGDPCEHLLTMADGKYVCRVYEDRLGLHKTRSGRLFRCVPIRDILHERWPGDGCCGYKK